MINPLVDGEEQTESRDVESSSESAWNPVRARWPPRDSRSFGNEKVSRRISTDAGNEYGR